MGISEADEHEAGAHEAIRPVTHLRPARFPLRCLAAPGDEEGVVPVAEGGEPA